MSLEISHPNPSEHAPAWNEAAGDPHPRIGARVWIEGVVMSRRTYGISVRLSDGTIQGFSHSVALRAELESPGDPGSTKEAH